MDAVRGTGPDGTPAAPGAERVTALLHGAGHDVTVVAADAVPVGTGQMGAAFRLRLTFDGDPGEVPDTIVAKVASGTADQRAISSGSYRTEVDFYRLIAPRVTTRTARCWASWIADDATEFVLLLEDLAPRRQGDQIRGCDVDRTVAAAVNLAGLHAPLWNDHRLATVLTPFDEEQAAGLDAVFPVMADMFIGRYGDRLAPATIHLYERMKNLTGRWFLGRPEPFGVVHGDYRLDNLLFGEAVEDVAIVDWQTVSIGLPARDLAFLCSTGMEVADRRAAEHDVVAAYHRALVAGGVRDHTLSDCLADYAYGMLQAPLVVVFGSAIAQATERGDEMFTVMAERSAAAIIDHGTLELLP